MKAEFRPIVLGVALLFGSIGLDLAGTALHSLGVLVISFIAGVAGALVAARGVIDLLASAG